MISTFICTCNNQKTHRLIFDGGSAGQYAVELCNRCYQQQEKRFLISEELLK